MADKRMFTKEITQSDDFLDMPHSARCLYYDLNLTADDDGFVNSPNKVMRISDATKEDLKLLFEKRFILAFEGNVVCVKHWLMHNTLKKDRYKPTKYQEFLDTLDVKENGAYTEKEALSCLETERNRSGTEVEPKRNRSIVKDSKVKESKEERRKEEFEPIKNLFNSLCPSFPAIEYLSKSIKNDIADCLDCFGIEGIETAFKKAEASDFLKGKQGWRASFDWLVKPENMVKVLNGNFDQKKTARQAELEAYERMAQERLQNTKTAAVDPDIKERAEALKKQISTA